MGIAGTAVWPLWTGDWWEGAFNSVLITERQGRSFLTCIITMKIYNILDLYTVLQSSQYGWRRWIYANDVTWKGIVIRKKDKWEYADLYAIRTGNICTYTYKAQHNLFLITHCYTIEEFCYSNGKMIHNMFTCIHISSPELLIILSLDYQIVLIIFWVL